MGSADISLRHIARRWAADLARGLIERDEPIEVIGWLDTQVTATERRLDKAMLLRIANEQRALHVELEVDPGPELPRRVFAEAMASVLAEIRGLVPRPEERAEIYAAMAALADLKPWGYSLRPEIRDIMKLTDDAVFRESVILQEAFADGKAEGFEKGRAEGLEASIERTLRRLFLRRSGRSPTPAEQQALTRRAHETTPEQIADLADELPGQALIDWLLGK